jgi:hypothetical protein
MRTKMAKRSTRTTSPRSKANFTSAPATELPSETSAFGDSAEATALIEDDVDEPTRAVSMASEPPELSTSAPDEEQVRNRAYQRFLDRGGNHGYDVNDWIEAEDELRNRK